MMRQDRMLGRSGNADDVRHVNSKELRDDVLVRVALRQLALLR